MGWKWCGDDGGVNENDKFGDCGSELERCGFSVDDMLMLGVVTGVVGSIYKLCAFRGSSNSHPLSRHISKISWKSVRSPPRNVDSFPINTSLHLARVRATLIRLQSSSKDPTTSLVFDLTKETITQLLSLP